MDARIDKFLWSVRIYKTRTIAAEAIKKGRISMGGTQVKASRTVKAGDTVDVRVPPATRSFKIIDIPRSRVGAKLVPNYITEVTAPDQLEIIELQKLAASMNRQKGLGRPTKRIAEISILTSVISPMISLPISIGTMTTMTILTKTKINPN